MLDEETDTEYVLDITLLLLNFIIQLYSYLYMMLYVYITHYF